MIEYQFDDGGREAAGYKGEAGDCAVRAIAIAAEMDYREVYNLIARFGKRERITKSKRSKSHPRTGVYTATMRKIMDELGWTWTPLMGIGTGCRVHLDASELPAGRIICRVSKHFCAVIDGVLHDTHRGDRGGTRCVYGYWHKP